MAQPRGIYKFKEDDVFRFAREQGLKVSRRGNEAVFNKCPFCGALTKDKKTFAINLTTGQYKCMRASCGAVGNMITLHKAFGFDLGTDVTEYERPAYEWRSFGRPEQPIKPTSPAVTYLASRGIPESVVEQYEITTTKDDDNVLLFPCYGEDGNIQFIKFRQINFDKEKGGSKEWCAKDGRSILFGMNHCNPKDGALIITEGQIDSLSVTAAGIKNAVSVPMGKNGWTWIPHCWDWVHKFKKIIVFGDFENGTMTLLEDIRKHFSALTIGAVNSQAYKGCKDANELLQKYGVDAVRAAVESARPIMPSEIKCMSDIKYSAEGTKKVPTGIHKLDVILNGGLPIGSLNIVTGKRGDGKSTLTSMVNKSMLEQGYATFAYSGEMLPGEVKRWLDLQIAGPSRVIATKNGDYINYSLSAPNISRISEWYADRSYIYDTSFMSDTPLMTILEKAILQYNCKLVIIDNLMTAIDMSGSDDRYAKQSEFCKQLAKLAQATEAIIILVAHMKKQDGTTDGNDRVSGSGDITNLASVVLSYERNDKELGENQRLIKVLKNRDSGRVDFNGFVIDYDPASRRICGPDDDLQAEGIAFAEPADGFVSVPDDFELPF